MINLIGNDYKKIESLKKNIDAMIIIKKKLETQEKWALYYFRPTKLLNLLFNFPKSIQL